MGYVPEDKDQALVVTPYGKGTVVRTREKEKNHDDVIREIELTDWIKPVTKNRRQRPSMLFSPTNFPSVAPKVGDDVKTLFGRGTITAIRDDSVLVVRISSWRLSGRNTVTCYLSPSDPNIQVVRPKTVYQMSVYEKVENAQKLKADASVKFTAKQFKEALELYSEAVNSVRYAQHTQNSTNELRADLLVVMITCCNNAATCCIQLQDWDKAYKFGKNALVLLEALYKKRGDSKIHDVLNQEGFGDSQLFGTWKVKSYIVIARGLAEKFDTEEALEHLKKGQEMLTIFKKEGDVRFQQLASQEKQIRKLQIKCKERLKAERKKERQRAKAMFGGSDEKKDPDEKNNSNEGGKQATAYSDKGGKKSTAHNTSTVMPVENGGSEKLSPEKIPHEKSSAENSTSSFADKSKPGWANDDDAEPTFWEEHGEALCIAGVGAVSLLSFLAFRRR